MATAVEEKVPGRSRSSVIAELFEAHYPSLRGLAFVLLGDRGAAEEIASEAFVKAFSGWNRFRTVDYPPAYLRQIVVNLCRGRIRRQGIERRVRALGNRNDADDRTIERRDQALDLWGAVKTLPERQRICVVLRYLEDLPEQEIADALGCSVGTVKSQLFKARAKLHAALQETTGGEA